MKLKLTIAGISMLILVRSTQLLGQSQWFSEARLAAGKYEWTKKANYPGGVRVATVGFAYGNAGFLLGGTNGSSEFSELYQYDLKNNSWTKKASIPMSGMREPAAFVIDSFAYVGLGFRSGATSHVKNMYKYNFRTNSWSQIKDFYQGRRASAGFAIDSLGYIIGGFEYGYGPDNSLYSYSPKTNTWTKRATMPGLGRSYPACAVVNGKAYVMGGMLSNGSTYVKDFYRYDPVNDKWDTLATFPGGARKGASVFVRNNKLFIGNGKDNSNHFQDWYEYDINTDKWTTSAGFISDKVYSNAFFQIGNALILSTGAYNSTLTDSTWAFEIVGTKLAATVGFSSDSVGYVFGGTDLVNEYSDLYAYNPKINQWTKLSSMPVSGMREPAAFVIGSNAYVGLGFRSGAGSHISAMYKYEFSTDKWTAVKSFYQGRRAASGFSIDSIGYIIGGFEYGYTPDNSFYAYSPTTNSWSKKASMPGLGRSYPVSAVVNGLAYVMGGLLSNGSTCLNDFYSYNPATNKWDTLTSFPGTARKGASAFAMGDNIFIGSGKDNSNHFQDWWGYDTKKKQWFSTSNVPSLYNYGNANFVINGEGYLATGAYNTTLTDSVYKLSYKTNSINKPVIASGSSESSILHYSFTRNLELDGFSSGKKLLLIYDQSGRVVWEYQDFKTGSHHQITLPELPGSIYIVEVIDGNVRKSLKIAM